jgi:hypothetical protein
MKARTARPSRNIMLAPDDLLSFADGLWGHCQKKKKKKKKKMGKQQTTENDYSKEI